MPDGPRIIIIAGPNGAGKTTFARAFLPAEASFDSPEQATVRVATRVAQGGHDIPEAVIRRRFAKGLDNFHEHHIHVVDSWVFYDGSGLAPALLDWSGRT